LRLVFFCLCRLWIVIKGYMGKRICVYGAGGGGDSKYVDRFVVLASYSLSLSLSLSFSLSLSYNTTLESGAAIS
jgi:hypothetical protein